MPGKTSKSAARCLAVGAICSLLSALTFASVGAKASSDDSSAKTQLGQLAELQILDQRVADIGWKLGTRNLELCPRHFAATGITLHSLTQYSSAWRNSAREAFHLELGMMGVLAVPVGSPAWKSGLRPNDLVVSLNGERLTGSASNDSPKGDYSDTDKAMAVIENVRIGAPVLLEIQRGTDRFRLSVSPIASCASRFELATSNQLNANSNGRVVQVFGRLVVALPSDDDLALVMAHELAHNALDHNRLIKSRHLSTGLGAAFTGSGKVLRDFEREADRYGIFMSARAGFAYRHAAAFWKRFASKGGIGSLIAITHPSPKNRERNAQTAVNEVDLLTAQHKPLIPGATTAED